VGDKRPEVSPASAGETMFSLIKTLDLFFVDGRCGAIDSLQDVNWKRVRVLSRAVVAAIRGKNPGHGYNSVELTGLQNIIYNCQSAG
jgi:precorrin-6B methylase 2